MAAIPNSPDLWGASLPRPKPDGHKYHRGHSILLGAEIYTGATRLAAEACSRIGSGLVTVLSDQQADTYRATLPPDIMVRAGDFARINRPTTVLAGPGGCNEAQARLLVQTDPSIDLVLDADAIRMWPELTDRSCILTPHATEFERYFDTGERDPIARAGAAAENCNSIVILKGPETVIAAPDGRVVMNQTASPYLAKAGTGDVLAGLITGWLAQGMPAFEAACAGVWIHGRAGQIIGPGLIPQDIIAEIRPILAGLLA